jgi:hypothetical protein
LENRHPLHARSDRSPEPFGHKQDAMKILGWVMAACSLALVIALLAWPRDRAEHAPSPLSDAFVFIAGSGAMYKETKADAQIYLDLLNSAGPLAQALDGVGGLPDPIAAEGIRQVFDLRTVPP